MRATKKGKRGKRSTAAREAREQSRALAHFRETWTLAERLDDQLTLPSDIVWRIAGLITMERSAAAFISLRDPDARIGLLHEALQVYGSAFGWEGQAAEDSPIERAARAIRAQAYRKDKSERIVGGLAYCASEQAFMRALRSMPRTVSVRTKPRLGPDRMADLRRDTRKAQPAAERGRSTYADALPPLKIPENLMSGLYNRFQRDFVDLFHSRLKIRFQ